MEGEELKLLIYSTRLVELVMAALQSTESSEFSRYVKLEAVWILINITAGDEEELKPLFSDTSFINTVNALLKSPLDDLQLTDQLMYLFGNMTGSSTALRVSILEHFNLLGIILFIMRSQAA